MGIERRRVTGLRCGGGGEGIRGVLGLRIRGFFLLCSSSIKLICVSHT